MFNKLTIFVLIIGILGGVGGYLVYKKQAAELEAAKVRNTALQGAIDETNQTLDRVRENAANQANEINNLRTRLDQAQEYNTELRRLLADHDLTFLAEEKPGLIEKRINDGTKEVFDSIERFTRSR